MDRPILHSLVDRLREDERLRAFAQALPARARVSEPVLPLVLAALHEELERGLVVALPDDADARDVAEAAAWFLGEERVALFPSRGVRYASGLEPPPHLVGERARALAVLEAGGLVCASAVALAEGVPPAGARPAALALARGDEPGLDAVAEHLADAGYERVERVEERGQFAVRGGLVDVFPTTGREPLRIELFGDEVEQIRAFSPFTQRALREVDAATVYPAAERRRELVEIDLGPDEGEEEMPAAVPGDLVPAFGPPDLVWQPEEVRAVWAEEGLPGGPVGAEGEGLRLRERRRLGRAVEGQPGQLLLGPHGADLLGLPDEIGRAEGRHEVAGDGGGHLLLALVGAEIDLDQLPAPFGGRVHGRRVDLAERPLRERREGADLLHLVAEELDAERLAAGGREDVDQAAAHGELAALLDALDPFVARVRQVLGDRVEPWLVAARERERGGARPGRRHALGQRDRRRADEPTRLQHGQGAGPLADQVRRRLQPRGVADAARGEERDPLLAEEPGRRLGDVPRVRVVRQRDDEPALELLVQRRQHERQHRLRYPRARGQRLRERAQALVLAEAVDQAVQDRTVHDERPERAFRAGRPW